jgi:cytidyltransferase-like protein
MTGVILDGSHRYAFLLKHGYKKVPTLRVNYLDENVRVGTRLKHRYVVEKPTINKQFCLERAWGHELLPARTTRHFFPFIKEDFPVRLEDLDRGSPVDISYLLEDVTLEQEVAHNRKYLEEILEEFDVITDYLKELKNTKDYIQFQVRELDRKPTALFPGKFDPVHAGHLMTINRLKKQYDLTIAITGDPGYNQTMSIQDRQKVLSEFAPVVLIEGKLIDKPQYNLKQDYILSGNPDVIAWAKRLGLPNVFVERSGSISSRQLRKSGLTF